MDQDDAGRVPVGSAGPMSGRLQALLSHAAQEQLSEQRQVSMVLTDLRQLVTGQGEAIDRFEAAASRPTLTLEQLRSELVPVLAWLTELEQRLSAVADRLADLHGQVGAVSVPSADAVASAVTHQVSDRLVDELAPRVADLVLTRVATTLVERVSGSVTTSIQDGLAERVRAATTDSEQRISAHVDEAVLALAEALLRRRRDNRAGVLAAVAPEEPAAAEAALQEAAQVEDAPDASEHDALDGGRAGA